MKTVHKLYVSFKNKANLREKGGEIEREMVGERERYRGRDRDGHKNEAVTPEIVDERYGTIRPLKRTNIDKLAECQIS